MTQTSDRTPRADQPDHVDQPDHGERPERADQPERARVERYDPASIEPRWQQTWADEGLYAVDLHDTTRRKFYLLTMYPYPSGDLHIGHWYIKTPTDAIARFHRMHGENVFLPIGFDAFGLPAENAAIKNNINPRDWTMRNIENMRRQLRTMGATFDWSAEVVTADPVVLPLEPVALPAVPRRRASPIATTLAGRLVPERRDARPGAGRGHRPPLLAVWREGREARARPVVPPNHGLRRRAARTSRESTGPSRSSAQQTNWIGRIRGRRDRVRDRAVGAPRRRRASCACSRPVRTRCTARRSWSSPRSTRSSPS